MSYTQQDTTSASPATNGELPRAGIVLVHLQQLGDDKTSFDKWRATAFDPYLDFTFKSILSEEEMDQNSDARRAVNVYHIDNVESITDGAIEKIRESSQASKDIVYCDCHVYERLRFFPGTRLAPSAPKTTAKFVSVGFTIPEHRSSLENFHAWYNTEHMPGMSTVSGWRCATRYTLYKTLGEGKVARATPFLAVHEWDVPNGLGGDRWREVVFTPWTTQILDTQSSPMQRIAWVPVDPNQT